MNKNCFLFAGFFSLAASFLSNAALANSVVHPAEIKNMICLGKPEKSSDTNPVLFQFRVTNVEQIEKDYPTIKDSEMYDSLAKAEALFYMSEYRSTSTGLINSGRQIFLFDSSDKVENQINFVFFAPWKANGKVNVSLDAEARAQAIGSIDQKGYVTNLYCSIEK